MRAAPRFTGPVAITAGMEKTKIEIMATVIEIIRIFLMLVVIVRLIFGYLLNPAYICVGFAD